MAQIKIGQCGLCTNKIWDEVLDKYGRVISRRPNSNYAELNLMLSDDTLAKVAVCTTCLPNVTEQQVQDLMVELKLWWRGEMVGWASDKQFAKIDKVEIKAWDREEDEAVKKHKNLKKVEHLEKVKPKKGKN